MVRNTRNKNGAEHPGAPAPDTLDPTGAFEAFLRRLERIGGNHGNNGAPPRQTSDKLLERFRPLRPEKFNGMTDAWQAEQWLREMDSIFETMECTEQDKRR